MKHIKILKSSRSLLIAGTIAISSIFFIGFDDSDDFELAKNMDIYHTLVRELRLFYVDDIEISKIFRSSIDDMLQTLDPYTVYYPESEIEDFRFMTTGQYGGIGALMRTEKDKIVIEEIYENYPADKAGFKVGDIITKVGDQVANSKNYDDVSILMKGIPDSQIDITVFRPTDDKEYTKTLTRERIQVENVPYFGMLKDNIGYIKLTGFTQTAYDEVKSALVQLKVKNADKIILDLRNNPGGLLIEAVKIVSLFVNEGTSVVSTKGKVQQWNHNFTTNLQPVDIQIPLAVLVSRNSASASEIVSGALQDLDRAIIVGERTYGKGLVQTTRDLSYNAKLKVTTAKYYIPSGRCIQALDYTHRNSDGSVGFIPDSLISEFRTLSGRKVYDGGGVIPDIKVEESDISPIAQHLFNDLIIFDFATQYASKHDSIPPPEIFKLNDNEFNDFVDFALTRNVNYKTETEKELDKLIEIAKKEKYYKKVNGEIEALKKGLNHQVRDDIIYFKDDITDILEIEIVRRYYYRKGAIINSLAESNGVEQSIAVLKDQNKYNTLLKP
ncbi:MAG: S41 family peptidase [Bacteroidales bacterium]|nr:S41 family peptidase [Bacteroidales bacterium]